MLYDYKGLLKQNTIRPNSRFEFDQTSWNTPTKMSFEERQGRLKNENYQTTSTAANRIQEQVIRFFLEIFFFLYVFFWGPATPVTFRNVMNIIKAQDK